MVARGVSRLLACVVQVLQQQHSPPPPTHPQPDLPLSVRVTATQVVLLSSL